MLCYGGDQQPQKHHTAKCKRGWTELLIVL